MSATATSPRTRLNPKPIDRGTRRLMIAKHLSNIPVNCTAAFTRWHILVEKVF